MSEYQIHETIRTINPLTFDRRGEIGGYRIVYEGPGEVRPYKEGFIKNLFRSRETVHYFVKDTGAPQSTGDWEFRWTEGATAIALEFKSSFEVYARSEAQACGLVGALHAPDGPGEALYRLIHACLHRSLERQFEECRLAGRNLLALFRSSEVGIGESEVLNNLVSAAVRETLGGAHFRIGFELKNLPPMQVELGRQKKARDTFTLADSARPREVDTNALLELENYQAFQKSGVRTVEDVQKILCKSITAAVNGHLFGRKYYEAVKEFSRGSIQAKMEELIVADAAKIGYRVKLFQTFPDIAALTLLEPRRIDIPSEVKYYPKNSTGYVQMQIALSVQARDFERLHLLINPDAPDSEQPIKDEVRRICQDQIDKITRQEFNLEFEQLVVPQLTAAITEGLGRFDLAVDIIKIVQAATEEAARYKAIRGRTTKFEVRISPQAAGGREDAVTISGNVEVIGIERSGWEQFESKDFGFRSDSSWTETRMRQHADELKNKDYHVFVPDSVLQESDRRTLAIDFELAEIRNRVIETLRETMSKVEGLSAQWTTLKTSQKIVGWAETAARSAIAQEFGLTIALRGVYREDTLAEATLQTQREHQYHILGESAKLDAEAVIESIRRTHLREQDAIDFSDPNQEGKSESEDLRKGRLTWQGATELVKNAAPKPQEQLPWETQDPAGDNATGSAPDGRP